MKIYSIYDPYDNDTLVYTGDLRGAAHYLGIQEKSVKSRCNTPYDKQTGRFKVICEPDDDYEQEESAPKEETPAESESQKLKKEINKLNDEIGILRTTLLNMMVADRTLTEIKKDILNLRYHEVIELVEWLKEKGL